ncbi:MAG TPA: hypothetical protein VHW64_18180 [Nocardioides sp.]|uniref:hypothetical protein n=1 Tax=Nocardioides sp. TaxID=35761 RepID=UPI002E33748C|nr:hypothetical protein [Nocardioides sp.]HEX3932629.1 hypothetical protein [Nocardioides sp.]
MENVNELTDSSAWLDQTHDRLAVLADLRADVGSFGGGAAEALLDAVLAQEFGEHRAHGGAGLAVHQPQSCV